MECATYINALQKGERACFLVRGVHDDIDIRLCKHSTESRVPLNMDEVVHKAINQHFMRIFKWPVRNGVFCAGVTNPKNEIRTLGYGRNYLMFPCGEFEYVYDEGIFDLYEHYREFFDNYPNAEISEFIGSINYSNVSLQLAMSNVSSFDRSAEIMINCQEYYLVNFRYTDELIDLIWH